MLFMVDATETNAIHPADIWPEFFSKLPDDLPFTVIRNKVDLNAEPVAIEDIGGIPVLHLSAKTGHGIDLLREHLKHSVGYTATSEGSFMARRRHLDALERAREHLLIGQDQLEMNLAGELLAEELRITQQHLNEITGEFTSDDLLTKIFSSFCIGK